ncbi:hypothetical protein DTW89_10795 [Acidovorax sp. BoFeN1]|uniref:hypothetical protein n=1 Tax=Acidovorax sp. BoFeN1 TaxID=1231053 RepID=UPI000E09B61E|nr:hypothetical protein [Acidovorax sp. BoFeN1]RDD92967.1 hypothetical protein DTW89_10795 [Acidovorax sp. BoFeN1]
MNTLSSSTNAVQRNASDGQLPELQRALLNRLLEQMLSLGVGVPALKFRAENYSDVATLDQLETSGLLKRDNDTYVVQSAALSFLDAEPARRVLSNIERVYAALRAQYRQTQQAQVPITLLTAQAQLSVPDVIAALQMMLDTSVWCAGWSTDLLKEDAFVSPGEGILKHESYAQLVDEVRSWSAPRALLPRFDITSSIDVGDHREPERDVERMLPPAQAEAVLSVAEDLEGMDFGLNDYYDDIEPQGVIDNVLTGKINTLRVYCETIGWLGLARRLKELTPLRGDAVEAMALVKSFIIPEVRRLAIVQATTKPKEVIHMDNVLRAWPAVRACLQEFHFYDIKEVAGLAGFDVTAAAHLVQKSQGGATKGQLMSAIDEQVGRMDSRTRSHFLTILIEEILRRRSEMQEKLSEYLSRLGWSFVSQTLVPLEVFDVSILADTPDESHKDLLKAAQRLRDGDLGGAISAACGAVDTATSKVYEEQRLGDPTRASFQERCKRAALAKGVLTELDRQLDALGWSQAEVSPFKKNLEGALNQGAYVMQTLRSHMGDVHGTKPILRSLVFDCLRWAELIVGSLVERRDTS